MSKLRLMSQNQWYWSDNRPEWQELGLDSSAATRMHGHIQVFKDLMPDVVGGQEITPEMQQYFKFYAADAGLSNYDGETMKKESNKLFLSFCFLFQFFKCPREFS